MSLHRRIINEKLQRTKYVGGDLLAYNFAFFLFNIFRYHFLPNIAIQLSLEAYLSLPLIVTEQILVPLGMMFLAWLSGFYNKVSEKSRLQEFMSTFYTAIIGAFSIFMLMLINDHSGRRRYDYELLLMLIFLMFICPYIIRLCITTGAIRHFRKAQWRRNTVFIGSHAKAKSFKRKINSKTNRSGINIIKIIPLSLEDPGNEESGTDYINEIKQLYESNSLDQIIIAPQTNNDKKVMQALYKLFPFDVPIKIAPDEFSFVTQSIKMEDVYGEPFIDLTSPGLTESSKNIKRLLDVIISAVVLVVISPIMLILSAAIKATSKGPVFYSQERIGYRHKPFKIYKFRSMRTDAESAGPQLSSENDTRVTPLGRILRKYRLDELPQFWNVLKGDMSLVGPRPEREYYIQKIVKRLPYYTLLSQVRPGITSWGMVKYGYARNVDEMLKRAHFDLIYLTNMSLAMDTKIMIYTIKTIVTGKGL